MTDPFMKRIEEECKRRLFWCSYNLDKYLGAMLGRPCVFHDEDIDQDYPSMTVYNPDLGVCLPTEEPNRRILIAPVLHFKLVRIVSRALREMYSVRPPTQKRSALIRRQLNDSLKAWRKELPAFLDPDQVDARLLVPNFQRQSNMLSLAYSHAVILVNRGSLMNKLRKSDVSSDTAGDEEDSNMKACLSAAMSILNDVDQIRRGGKILPAWWFTQYQAFCAVVIIYTYTVHAASSMVQETQTRHFQAAERCQAHIEAIAQDGTLAQRYFIVMEEFRLEAVDHMSRSKAKTDGAIAGPLGSGTPSTNLFTDEELIRVMNGFIDPGVSLGAMGLDEWPDLDGMDIGINDDMNEAVRF
ncbi:Glyoxylate reductase [Lasiodiplodia theobromae]|uniref:Glyoxylate reductase n=1 Tax=Lasiodiplodia theobromae TaxID=45133 RepID=UPI0015C38C00|nr:Glyoxylate reductase [Lasiodiplodia theobromae]KAF4541450.1 Glyoxylate reductase [Lasiodiplodia theobromae]